MATNKKNSSNGAASGRNRKNKANTNDRDLNQNKSDTMDNQVSTAAKEDPKKVDTSELRDEIEQLENKLKKALADYQNLKKEMERRLDFERNMIRKELIREVISLADDIDIAIDHVEDEKGWREGITRILEKFRKTLDDMGAELIETKQGDKFDASVHEAVGVTHKGEPGTIATVVQNGYRLGDVVIRPVRVIVNKINKDNKNE
jgi:molecular chaperone GrpE